MDLDRLGGVSGSGQPGDGAAVDMGGSNCGEALEPFSCLGRGLRADIFLFHVFSLHSGRRFFAHFLFVVG